jgi:hypothetical protein
MVAPSLDGHTFHEAECLPMRQEKGICGRTYGELGRIRPPERGIAYGPVRAYGDGVPIVL